MEPFVFAITTGIVLITLTLYHGLHVEFYNYFYQNSDFDGPKSMVDRLKSILDLWNQRDPLYPYWSLKKDSGGVIRISFGLPFIPTIYAISDAKIARTILQDSATNNPIWVRHERPSMILKGILDYALFVLPTGPLWRKHRKILQPAFAPSHLRHTGVVTISVAEKLQRIWAEKESITVNIKNVLGSMTMDVISQVAYGHDLKMVDRLEKEDDPKWNALDTLTSGIVSRRAVLPSFLWSLAGVGNSNPKIKAAKLELNSLLRKLADERRQAIADGKVGQEKWEMDVLQRLLFSSDEGAFNEDELFGEMLGFFLAGFETTANTLSFAILELCRNKEIQEKLFDSVKHVSLTETNDPLPLIDPTSLKYLDNFLKEVQRRHSIVPRVARKCLDNVVLLDRFIPHGSLVSVYIKGIHLNPTYHPSPLQFNPDRFDADIKPGTFLPFGDGPHMCIGYKMAVIEAKIILIKLVQKYRFEMVEGQSLREYVAITTSLKDGLYVNVLKRS